MHEKAEEAIIVSEDKALRMRSKNLHDSDLALFKAALNPGTGITLTQERFAEMARQGIQKYAAYAAIARERMTLFRAARIRELRVNRVYSWRLIAFTTATDWQSARDPNKGGVFWEPLSNQLAGMALCEAAAEMFSENYREDPWN